jgi:hypothetical protein
MAGEKAADYTEGVKRKAPPKQPSNGSKKITQRRQMIKNRVEPMCLELAFLQQIHHAGDAGERERSVRDERNRSMKFQPRICWQLRWMTNVDRRNERKDLQRDHQRRGEGAH